jgi:hypothetical protein
MSLDKNGDGLLSKEELYEGKMIFIIKIKLTNSKEKPKRK